jgi:hypothetical protein
MVTLVGMNSLFPMAQSLVRIPLLSFCSWYTKGKDFFILQFVQFIKTKIDIWPQLSIVQFAWQEAQNVQKTLQEGRARFREILSCLEQFEEFYEVVYSTVPEVPPSDLLRIMTDPNESLAHRGEVSFDINGNGECTDCSYHVFNQWVAVLDALSLSHDLLQQCPQYQPVIFVSWLRIVYEIATGDMPNAVEPWELDEPADQTISVLLRKYVPDQYGDKINFDRVERWWRLRTPILEPAASVFEKRNTW